MCPIRLRDMTWAIYALAYAEHLALDPGSDPSGQSFRRLLNSQHPAQNGFNAHSDQGLRVA